MGIRLVKDAVALLKLRFPGNVFGKKTEKKANVRIVEKTMLPEFEILVKFGEELSDEKIKECISEVGRDIDQNRQMTEINLIKFLQ